MPTPYKLHTEWLEKRSTWRAVNLLNFWSYYHWWDGSGTVWKAYCPKLGFTVDLDFRFAGQRRYSVEMKLLSAETVGKDKKLFHTGIHYMPAYFIQHRNMDAKVNYSEVQLTLVWLGYSVNRRDQEIWLRCRLAWQKQTTVFARGDNKIWHCLAIK